MCVCVCVCVWSDIALEKRETEVPLTFSSNLFSHSAEYT